MQDNYVGDIGDYGKYGLLRKICLAGLSLSVNWYKTVPKKTNTQNDGKFVNYLSNPEKYREYDPHLFDSLYKIVCTENQRKIERIEKENLFIAKCFSDEIRGNRLCWHQNALNQTANTEVIFLDPDNGLETVKMFSSNGATEKHVKWAEIKDYYDRGQSVILYQHLPRITKEQLIDSIMSFQKEYLKADFVKLLEFPKYTNRFYFIFSHEKHIGKFEMICNSMVEQWGKNNFCKEIIIK